MPCLHFGILGKEGGLSWLSTCTWLQSRTYWVGHRRKTEQAQAFFHTLLCLPACPENCSVFCEDYQGMDFLLMSCP